ncbi:luciferin 4-monooxygenase-like [Epargyreus clarus]|uniref:luciferin 4-monooxygenase-like n=1 Tax=Epargyreus clarus TaxID=520877 RepID=UPI003C2D4A9D
MPFRRSNDAVHWFVGELTSRIIAESGIPSDRFHLGKIIFQSFKDAPDAVMQIDGATGISETNEVALQKSVRCAVSMQKYGLQCGDTIVLMAPSHVDIAAPFYAALYLGVAIAAVDRTLGVKELQGTFNIVKPKVIFCQSEKASDVQIALNDLDLNSLIVTFDKGDYLCNFSEFLESYGDDAVMDEFRPSDFDPEDTIAFLLSTSGTTGLPKCAAVTHKNMAITLPYTMARFTDFPTPTRVALIGSPLQWLTAIINFSLSPILRYTRVQTSDNFTPEHAYHLINTYRPTYAIFSPTSMTTLIAGSDQCDFTCFELLMLAGSAVPKELVEEIKRISPETEVLDTFGMSELTSIAFHGDYAPPGSCGKPMGCFQYRVINVDTQEDINEPNVPGELWMKGPGIFKEYYNNPQATEDTFAVDRWFKTGDLFYRDENWNFFFMERIKLLLKYKSYQISPVELENVIRQHPGIFDVAVTGIPDPECGDLPVACVVLRDGSQVTAEEIKDLVKESLSNSKQLRGGVIFVNEIPLTASTKIHRRKLKEMVVNMERL